MKSDATPQTVDYATVNNSVLRMLEPPTIGWFVLLLTCVSLVIIGGLCWVHQMINGMGVAGIGHPIAWGVYITNFVFWVGIAHSGTLISAVLYLFRAKFRMPIYRLSEAMTVFAVMTAGLFPLIHVGRPWFAYWLMPYPNERTLWPNFRSPLLWDVFAISTYFTVSAVFFFVGLIPDIAAARDRAKGVIRKYYTVLLASVGLVVTNSGNIMVLRIYYLLLLLHLWWYLYTVLYRGTLRLVTFPDGMQLYFPPISLLVRSSPVWRWLLL